MTTEHPQATAVDQKKVRKAALAGLIGTTLELYDFVIYGTASALVFSHLFFPNISPAAALLASFSTFAVGFLFRPLGGIFFSHFGDRLGRKWILVTTLLLMGGATLVIGLLPTFEQVGVLAPLLLCVCRAAQGFGAGAEQSGGATLLTESAAPGTRGKLASLIMVGAAAGTALGALVWIGAQALAPNDMMTWGWRLVFLSSIFVTIAALVIRRKLDESPVFEEIKQARTEPPAPLREVAKFGKANVLRVILMNFGVSTQSYTIQVFMASYLITVVGTDPKFIPQVLLIGCTLRRRCRRRLRHAFRQDRTTPGGFHHHRCTGSLPGPGLYAPHHRFSHRHPAGDHRRLHARLPGSRRRPHELLPGNLRQPLPLRRSHAGP